MSYKDYLQIDSSFVSVYNVAADKRTPTAWQSFIPHESMKKIISELIKNLERGGAVGSSQSFWIRGAYGTGKTFATYVIEHLLRDDLELIKPWFEKHKIMAPLLERFTGLRSKGDFLVARSEYTSGIDNDGKFLLEIQSAVREALCENGYTYLGANTLQDEVRNWLNDDYFCAHREGFFGKYRTKFMKYSSFDDWKSRSADNPDDAYLIAKLLEEVENTYLLTGIEDTEKWLKDVIEGNKLQGIVLIWDEFSGFFQNNHSTDALQAMAAVSQKIPFYLCLAAHKTLGQFKGAKIDDETFKKIAARFSEIHFEMNEVTALGLLANAIDVKSDNRAGWEDIQSKLWTRVASAGKYYLNDSTGATIENLKKILPLHPSMANYLILLSQHFSSNARTMFKFLQDESASENSSLNYRWFLENKTDPELMTIDYLWDFYFVDGNSNVSDSLGAYLNHCHIYLEKIESEDARRVFKTIMLMLIIRSQTGLSAHGTVSTKTLNPVMSNLRMLYSGTSIAFQLDAIVNDLLAKEYVGKFDRDGNEFEFRVLTGTSISPEDLLERKKTLSISSSNSYSALIKKDFNELSEKKLFSSEMDLGSVFSDRFVIKICESHNASNAFNILSRSLKPYQVGVLVIIFREDDGLVSYQKWKNETDLDNRMIVVLVDEPFSDKVYEDWLTKTAYAELLKGSDSHQSKNYYEEAEKTLKNWFLKVMSGQVQLLSGSCNETFYYKKGEFEQRIHECLYTMFPSAPELLSTQNTLYKPADISAFKYGLKSAKPTAQYQPLLEKLSQDGIWENTPNSFIENSQNSVSKLYCEILKQFEQQHTMSVVSIWQIAQQSPYGLRDTGISMFIMGLVLREFATGEYYYVDAAKQTQSLNADSLGKILGDVIKEKKNHESYAICKMRSEDRKFCEQFPVIFGYSHELAKSPKEAVSNARIKINEIGLPIWILSEGAFADDMNGKHSISLIEDIISDKSFEPLNEKIDAFVACMSGQFPLLEKLSMVWNDGKLLKEYFINFISERAPFISEKADTNDKLRQVIANLRNNYLSLEPWLWNKEGFELKLAEMEQEYMLRFSASIFSPNNFIESKLFLQSLKDSSVGESKLPLVIWTKYKSNYADFLLLLDECLKTELHLFKKKDVLHLEFVNYGQSWRNSLAISEQTKIMGEYVKYTLKEEVDSNELAELVSKIGNNWQLSQEEFSKKTINIIGEIRNNRANTLVNKIWKEISASNSVQDWSRMNKFPFHWLSGSPEIIEILESASRGEISAKYFDPDEFSGQIKDCLQLGAVGWERLFVKFVSGENVAVVEKYQYFTAFFEILLEARIEIDKWDLMQCIDKMDQFLREKYQQVHQHEIISIINNMSPEQAKLYLLDVARKDSLLGLKLLTK